MNQKKLKLPTAVPLKNGNMTINAAIFEIPISWTVDGLEISEQNLWDTTKTHCNNLRARHALWRHTAVRNKFVVPA